VAILNLFGAKNESILLGKMCEKSKCKQNLKYKKSTLQMIKSVVQFKMYSGELGFGMYFHRPNAVLSSV
jgi:hypothetical protein